MGGAQHNTVSEVYLSGANFNERNTALTAALRAALSPDAMQAFKLASADYRHVRSGCQCHTVVYQPSTHTACAAATGGRLG